MPLTISRIAVITICLWTMSVSSLAQAFESTDCEKAVAEANKYYLEGHLERVRGTLDRPCLRLKTGGEAVAQAYRLLANTYLALDKLDSAKAAYLQLLHNDPVFLPDPDAGDVYEMIWLSTKFRSTPFLSVGLSLDLKPYGIGKVESRSREHLVKEAVSEFSVSNVTPPLSVAAHIIIPIRRRFELHTGVSLNKFEFEQTYAFNVTEPVPIGGNLCSGSGNYRGVEEQKSISIPLGARFYFLDVNAYANRRTRPVRLYLYGGVDFQLLSSARKSNARTTIPVELNTCSQSLNDIDLRFHDLRDPLNIATLIGIGANVPVRRHQVFMEIVYSSQLLDQSKPEQQSPLYDEIYFVDDSFRLRSIVFRLGGAFSFYNPKELK